MDIVEQLTKSGYRVLLCGHSLGAGTACLMAMVLQSRLPNLKEANKLHVYAFGCPPVLDLDAAEACAPFITAVVNGSDLIARSSLANLRTFLDFLRIIHDKYLDPAGLTPTNPKRTIDLIRKLCQGLDTDLVMSQPQVSAEIAVAQTRILLHDPQHLYIPGMVLLLSASSAPKEPVSDNSKHTKYECVVTTGSTHVLRFFDIGKGVEMVTDHLTTTYGERIDALIQRLHGNIENL
jgi:pimeloyl-ACP methyl ester carboxylesterase